VVLGVLVVAGLMAYSDGKELSQAWQALNTSVLAGVLGLVCLGYAFRIIKWQLYLRQLDISLPIGESTVVFLAGLVMSVTPAKVGEVLKSFLLRESRNIPVAKTAPVVVAERLTDLLALIILASWGAAMNDYGVGIILAATVLTGGLLALLTSGKASAWLIDRVESLPWIGGLAPKLREAYQSMAALIGAKTLLMTTLLSILAWGGEGFAFWLLLDAFPGTTASLHAAIFIFSFATLAGALTMLPGGLLATEASMIALLFAVFSLTPSEGVATSATLLIRFCTLWFAVVLGIFALIIYRWRYIPPSNGRRD
jgi:uncharacterized membrane protein YbhN (UPF0104 family)